MRSLLGRFHRPMSRGLVNNMLTMNNLGDGSTLSLDFTTMGGVLDPRLTFTRASTVATYINSNGYVATATTNAPRFDYSPTNIGEPRGLLIEGQTANLTTYSEDFANAAWTKSGIAQTPASGISPDNSNTATLIAENAGGFIKHSLERSVTVTAGSVYTWSVFLKEASSNSRRYACVQVADGQAIAARNTVVFDLQTGTVTANGVNNGTAGAPTDVAHSITPYRDGWYRVSVTMKYVSSPCYPTVILSDISTLYGGSNQPFYTATVPYKGLLVYGAQLELGSGASSYISTGASQVMRNPDYCQSTVASGIANWLTSLTTSTYFVDFVPMTQRGGFANTWNTRTSTFQGYEIYCFDGTAGVNLTCTTKISASTNVETNVATGLALNSRHKIAYSISAGSGLRSVNGSTVSAANPVALPTGTPSTFGVGSGGGGSGTSINAWIRSVKYYPTALTQTEINGMTAA